MIFLRVIGARPQFMQAAMLHKTFIEHGHQEIILHTGQHYNDNMCKIFFDQLELVAPDINLEVGSHSHGMQTGLILSKLDRVIDEKKPDAMIVDGDTNSTLAGAVAATKMCVPLIHVEAGLRSYDKRMPEEVNRVVTDHISDLLCAPTENAVKNLSNEGLIDNVYLTGDLMFDCFSFYKNKMNLEILKEFKLEPSHYILATMHRSENTQSARQIHEALDALNELPLQVIFPLHPRTEAVLKCLDTANYERLYKNIVFIPPVGYLEMLALCTHASIVITDSGGLQREAFFAKVPSIVLRNTTEWVEPVQSGWAMLAGLDKERIFRAYERLMPREEVHEVLYGGGFAAENIVQSIECFLQ